MSNDKKIIQLNAQPESGLPILPLGPPIPQPSILLSPEDEKAREAKRKKDKEKNDKEFEAQSKHYLQLIDGYVQRYVSALEQGSDLYGQMNLAWKMRCNLLNRPGALLVANPLDFEKAINRLKSMAQATPPLAEVINMLESKLTDISVLLHQYSDKEHVLWRGINEVLFPKKKEPIPIPVPPEQLAEQGEQTQSNIKSL